MNQTDSYTRSIHRTGRAGSLLAILWMLGIPAVMCGILVKPEYVGICRSDIIIERVSKVWLSWSIFYGPRRISNL